MLWLKAQWVKIGVFLGSISLLFAVYFIGRRNRLGEVNLDLARRELEKANDTHTKLQQSFTKLQDKRIDILADILEHETIALAKKRTITDAEVNERLRADGLIK